jgi:hypothetical protein
MEGVFGSVYKQALGAGHGGGKRALICLCAACQDEMSPLGILNPLQVACPSFASERNASGVPVCYEFTAGLLVA